MEVFTKLNAVEDEVHRELVHSVFTEVEDINDDQYAHIVYTEDSLPDSIYGFLYSNEPEIKPPSLKNYLQQQKLISFRDCLFWLTLYPSKYPENKFKQNSIVDDLLRESNGLILWHYQLENLIRLFTNNQEDVIRLRKGVNTKHSEIATEIERFKFNSGESLIDIINERMVKGNTCFPNLQGAYNLYNLF